MTFCATFLFLHCRYGVLNDCESHDKAGVIGEADMTVTYAQSFTNSPATLRPHDQRSTPIVAEDTYIAHPNAMRETRAHGLNRCFFAGEAHREKTNRLLALTKQFKFLLHQNTAGEMLPEPVVSGLYSRQLHDVGTNTENHR